MLRSTASPLCHTLEQTGVSKSPKVHLFTILKTSRFLSLRYSADFGRSRLVLTNGGPEITILKYMSYFDDLENHSSILYFFTPILSYFSNGRFLNFVFFFFQEYMLGIPLIFLQKSSIQSS